MVVDSPQSHWVLVAGAANSGKSALIRAIADRVVPWQHNHAPSQPTGVVTGILSIEGSSPLQLVEARTPIAARTMYPDLDPSQQMGTIIVVDSTANAHLREMSHQAVFAIRSAMPYVIAATKQDEPHAIPAPQIASLFHRASGHKAPVIPCASHNRSHVTQVLLALMYQIRDSRDDSLHAHL